jgi:hypothetical protein
MPGLHQSVRSSLIPPANSRCGSSSAMLVRPLSMAAGFRFPFCVKRDRREPWFLLLLPPFITSPRRGPESLCRIPDYPDAHCQLTSSFSSRLVAAVMPDSPDPHQACHFSLLIPIARAVPASSPTRSHRSGTGRPATPQAAHSRRHPVSVPVRATVRAAAWSATRVN